MAIMDHSDIHQKLAGIHTHITPATDSQDFCPETDRYRLMATTLGAELIHNHAGSYCLKRTLYTWDYRHGQALLNHDRFKDPLALTGFGAEASSATVDRDRLLFFDTETTGLGGAGVVPFLIGCGSYTAAGIEVRQYIIPDYTDEAAMLEALNEELTNDAVIVSYNGRAFDIPIVRDRMIINRVARDIRTSGHLDLLHATRRLYRRRLTSCTLTNIEREVFGFHREGDIPGYLIPSVYFEWLGEQKIGPIQSVLEHNCLDIISLAFLSEKIADIFACHGDSLSSVGDLHSLARVYGRRKQTDQVNRIYHRITSDGLGDLSVDALWFHSLAFKRSGQLDEAVGLWDRLTGGRGRESYLAHLELAKYYEHRLKQPTKALEHTVQARRLCPYGPSHLVALGRRLERLELKTYKLAALISPSKT